MTPAYYKYTPAYYKYTAAVYGKYYSPAQYAIDYKIYQFNRYYGGANPDATNLFGTNTTKWEEWSEYMSTAYKYIYYYAYAFFNLPSYSSYKYGKAIIRTQWPSSGFGYTGSFGYYYYNGTDVVTRYVYWHANGWANGVYVSPGMPVQYISAEAYYGYYISTKAYYAYTAAKYQYTAPVYSIIPAAYQYTAPIYAYTPPKYYQPIHYQYQTI